MRCSLVGSLGGDFGLKDSRNDEEDVEGKVKLKEGSDGSSSVPNVTTRLV